MAPLRSLDSETITVDDTSTGIPFTASKLTNSVLMAECIVTTGPVRVSCDTGAVLSAANGQPYGVGGSFQVWGNPDLKDFKVIEETTAGGKLSVEYFGEGS